MGGGGVVSKYKIFVIDWIRRDIIQDNKTILYVKTV